MPTISAGVPLVGLVVAGPLEPVHDRPIARWQRATVLTMSGPGASPLFRDWSNHMDCHWRLAQVSTEAPWISPEDEQRVLDLALIGASLGWGRTAQETLYRSPDLAQIHRVVQATTSPGVDIRQGEGLSVEAQRNPRAAMARLDGASRPMKPGVRMGTGFRLVDVDDDDESTTLQPGMGTFIHTQRIGLDRLQFYATLTPEQGPGGNLRWAIPMVAAARQQLLPGVHLLGEVQARPQELETRVARGGTEWRVPGLDSWWARLTATRRSARGSDPVEHRVDLRVHTRLRWRVPQDSSRWTLGEEPGTHGPQPIETPRIQPAGLTPLVITPAEQITAFEDEQGPYATHR